MKKLIFIGVLGLFALGSCNSKKTGHEDMTTKPSHTIMMSTKDMSTKQKDMTTKPKVPTIHTKVNAAEATTTTRMPERAVRLPANTVNQPENTATKSFSRKRKPTQPV